MQGQATSLPYHLETNETFNFLITESAHPFPGASVQPILSTSEFGDVA